MRSALLMLASAFVAPALAQVHATDVLLKVENSRIVTGRDEGGVPVYPRRAFSSELGTLIPNATTEPGFDSEPGAFTPQTLVGISLTGVLREWDGSDFDLVADERMRLTKGAAAVQTPLTAPALCRSAGDLPLGLANTFGVLHQHPAYELLAPADPGVYLLELRAWMGQPWSGASDPFWMVFAQNAPPAAVNSAVAYVESVLACAPDFNRDGTLTIADFGAFQAAFVLADPRADMNGDCALTIADFGRFQSGFVAGCD